MSPKTSNVARRGTAVALSLLAVLALAACGSSAATTPVAVSRSDQGPAPVSTPVSTLEVVAKDHSFTTPPGATLAEGPVTIRLRNEGVEPHQLQLAKVPAGFTAEQFIHAFEHDGEAAVMQQVEWVGGVNGTEPGATEAATANLPAGDYLMVCFIPTPGGPDPAQHGVSHVAKKMVQPLKVVTKPGNDTKPPTSKGSIELKDYAVVLPQPMTSGTYEVRNTGQEDHELILMRLKPGKTLADLVAWQTAGMPADKPFEFRGGLGSVAPGKSGWADLELPPGDYVALCVVQNAAHQAHVNLGMIATFTVA